MGDVVDLDDDSSFELLRSIYPGLGYSFAAVCRRPGRIRLKEGDDAFLKMPKIEETQPGMSSLSAVRVRFQAEFEKRELLDEICDLAAGGSQSHTVARMLYSGSIVRRARDGVVDRIDRDGGIPVLVHERVAGDTVEKWMVNAPWAGAGKSACPLEVWLEFAVALVTIVKRVHNQGILHGWLLPRNIIRRTIESAGSTGTSVQLVLVGFGYSALFDSAPPALLASTEKIEADLRYRAPELKIHQKAGGAREDCLDDGGSDDASLGALWVPADVFSVGAVLFRLATGEELPTRMPVSVTELKDLVFSELNRTNPELLVKNENVTKIIDKCLRSDPDDRYSCAEELLDELEEIQQTPIAMRGGPAHTSELIEVLIRKLGDTVALWQGPDFFSHIAQGQVHTVGKDFDRMKRGHFEIYGHRDILIASLCKFIASLGAGDEYCTMTLPSYWTDENLGSNGRFLTMNKHIARRGVRIRRLFLVSGEFFELPRDEQQVVEWQRRAVDHWKGTREPGQTGTFEVKVLRRADDEIRRFERNASFVAYIKPGSSAALPNHRPTVALNFISHGRKVQEYGRERIARLIKKVRFWEISEKYRYRQERFRRGENLFSAYWDEAVWLDDYMRGPVAEVNVDGLLALIEKQLVEIGWLSERD